MNEPKVEKKTDAQPEGVQGLLEQLKRLREENSEKEKKMIDELKARHLQEIQKLEEENREREGRLLSECNANHQTRTQALVMVLLRAKSERDIALLIVSCAAIGILEYISMGGFIHGQLPGIFMFAAILGFIATIIFVGQNIKRNSRYFENSITETILPDLIWEKIDHRPLRFLIFGFISTALLGISVYLNPQAKITSPVPTASDVDKKPLVLEPKTVVPPSIPQNIPPAVMKTNKDEGNIIQKPLPKPIPPTVTSKPKTNGNGGVFMGGSSGH